MFLTAYVLWYLSFIRQRIVSLKILLHLILVKLLSNSQLLHAFFLICLVILVLIGVNLLLFGVFRRLWKDTLLHFSTTSVTLSEWTVDHPRIRLLVVAINICLRYSINVIHVQFYHNWIVMPVFWWRLIEWSLKSKFPTWKSFSVCWSINII